MKKFLISGFIFMLCVGVLYVATFALLYKVENSQGVPLVYSANDYMHWIGGDSYERFREFDIDQEYDVVVLGSSHAYRGYDPRHFEAAGVNAFVLGSSAQTLDITNILARHYLSDYEGLIIIDTYSSAFEADALEPTLDLMANVPDHGLAAEIGWNFNDIRCVNVMMLRLMHGDNPPIYRDSNYVSGGFVWNSDSIENAPKFSEIGLDFDPRPDQVQAFAELIEWLQENDKNFLLVSHPLPLSTQREDYFGCLALIDSLYVDQEVPYLDYTFDHELHDHHHFYDYNHLNSAGVEYFNVRLISDLKQRGMLPRPK